MDMEEAMAFIEDGEKILNDAQELNAMIYEFEEKWGTIKDEKTFKQFFVKYLEDCPDKNIIKGVNVESEAFTLWQKVDINKNGILDENEKIEVVREIMKHSIGLIRKFYNLA